MEDLDPRGGERSADYEFEYVLWVEICLVIPIVISSDVGESVSKAPYLGASLGGGGTGRRDGRGGAGANLILKS